MMRKLFQPLTIFFNTGLLVGSLFSGGVIAAECGQAKLLTVGSVGVNVAKNACPEPDRIALGSALELAAGSRLWLKFDPGATGESLQLICQNKSQENVKINITNTTEPWIKTEGLKNCNTWKGNKLSCESRDGEKNSFFCAVATTKPKPSSSAPEQTTAIKMRDVKGIFSNIPVQTVSADDVIDSIKPDIELCKNLYNVTDKVDMSWTVSVGKIHDLTVASDNKDLVSCVEDVVKQANANQDLSIKYSF